MDNLLGSQDKLKSPAYDWVKKLSLKTTDGFAQAAWNVVAIAEKENELTIASKLDDERSTKLLEHLGALSWAPGQRASKVVIDSDKYFVVGKKESKVADKALFRQMGLDVAAEANKLANHGLATHGLADLDEAAFVEGFCVGLDRSGAFKSKVELEWPKEILVSKANDKTCQLSLKMAAAQVFTRWLQDGPANLMNSETLATIANDYFGKKAEVNILGRKEMEAQGMGSFLAVAKGTNVDPKLITIKFKGTDSSKTAALVGKGVTFDAGGINIKPSAGLDEMKYDMSGAAAVFGAAHFFADEKPPVDVVCAIGAVENMCSATAIRPGDIVRSMSGKTIEIINTDAEGRLVLADVMSYVQKEHKPQIMLDIATLTGAVIIGLGHAGCAYLTNDDSVRDILNKTAKTQGEASWQLPLWPELAEETKSAIADIKNLPSPSVKAGTIMGGYFLQEFVEEGTKWAHIDIAGTAWNCSATGYPKKGGSGFGLRTLVGACYELAEQ